MITGSPPNRNPTMPSSPISLRPGDMVARCTRRRSPTQSGCPSNHDCCIGWQRRSFGATRDVLPPLVVNGIQCIVRGGTAWWRLPVEFWSTGTVSAVFARKRPVHETRPETHRNGLRIWISTNTVCTRRDTESDDQVQPAVPNSRRSAAGFCSGSCCRCALPRHSSATPPGSVSPTRLPTAVFRSGVIALIIVGAVIVVAG